MSDYPWKTIDEDTVNQRIILLYGPSGAGKTYLAGQFPKPLILGCDPGTMGGAESAKQFGPKFLKIKDYNHLMGLVTDLEEAADEGEFETLIIDSISYFGQMIMRSILQSVGREIPRFEEWNLNATRMRTFINRICDVKAHIVFTAVDSVSKDETSGKMMGGPNLPGKLQQELPQGCDVVLRLYTSTGYDNDGNLKVNYRYRAVPDDVWFAKDRTGKIPKEGESSFDVLKPLFEKE